MTFSPTGRLFQVEYALEAIKQGSAAVGLRSKTHVVLVALKRNAEELGSYQKKLMKIDDNLGLALAGLAPDARVLAASLRTQSLRTRLLYDKPLAVNRAVSSIADKAQANTQQYGRRPYGVGLLVAGTDDKGPHLFEFLPSGSALEYFGAAIGARSQAARTYLERNFEKLESSDLEELVVHGLLALRDTLPQDKELTFRNTSVAVVGVDKDFTIIEDEDIAPWLDKLDSTKRVMAPAQAPQAEAEPAPAGEASQQGADVGESAGEATGDTSGGATGTGGAGNTSGESGAGQDGERMDES